MNTRSRVHPLILVALVAACLLSARVLVGQTPAAAMRRVAIATHAIPRGTVITGDDYEMRDTSTRGMVSLPDTAPVTPGWIARRSIAAGEILRAPAIEAPTMVSANSTVQVEFADKNVILTVRGVAARNGALGERVPVRTELGKRIEATVVAPGRVRVD
jgi:flagella basal body P-ring formation protein FlgA